MVLNKLSQSYTGLDDSSEFSFKVTCNYGSFPSYHDVVKNTYPSETGQKFDQDKVRVDLLDPVALEGLAKVLTFGAKKYAAHNWRGGISYSRLIGALLRHTFAILRGEDIDPESGLPHVDHLGCCWMFLSNMMKTRKDLDDRWKPQVSDSTQSV